MSDIETPRTNESVLTTEDEIGHEWQYVPVAFARQLERELAVAMESLRHITLTEGDDLKVSRTGMFRSAVSALQRIERMRRAYEEGK